ncbi:MAG: hypothetical protein ACP5SI_04160 [Chloroflexia bacterium]
MPKGGLARRATAIARFREQAGNEVLLLDSGNSLIAPKPTQTSDPSQGALPVAAMNRMGYDAMALGPKDLGPDLETVRQRFQEAAFPILAANVFPEGALPNLKPYLLRTVDSHTVAVVGLTDPKTAQRAQALGLPLAVEDPEEALRHTLAALPREVQVVIVLSNLDQASTEHLAQAVPGIDLIIGMNGGRQVDPKAIAGPEGQVVIHASYVQGEYLGVLTVQFDAQGRVVTFSGRSQPLDPQYVDDPEIAELMARYGVRP